MRTKTVSLLFIIIYLVPNSVGFPSGFPGGSEVKVSACNAGDLSLIPGLGRSLEKEMAVFLPGESHGRRSLVGYIPRGRKELDTTERLHFHFPSGSEVKNSPVNAGDAGDSGSILGSGDLLEEERATPLHKSCLNYPTDRVAWQVAVPGVPKCWTRL